MTQPNTDTDRQIPTEPPLATGDLAPLRGRLGSEPEDFQVDEIPAYLPSGAGSHRYVHVKKRLLTTPDLVHIIAKAAKVHESTIGHAGMKDKHAVTTQWLSLPVPSLEPEQWELPPSVEILESSLHTNKLRTGHLHGNRFTLRLVDLAPDDKSRFEALHARIQLGIYNGFGPQRFGFAGANLSKALNWLRKKTPLRGPKGRFLKKLNVSVIQSEIFNRYLIRRIEASLDAPLRGEVVRLKGSGSCFIVKEPSEEQSRWAIGDILPTGPMVANRIHPAATDDALALEQEVARSVCTEEELAEIGAEAPGARRDLRLALGETTCEWENDQILKLTFELPAGAYATELLRELTHTPWLQPKATGTIPPPNDEETPDDKAD